MKKKRFTYKILSCDWLAYGLWIAADVGERTWADRNPETQLEKSKSLHKTFIKVKKKKLLI